MDDGKPLFAQIAERVEDSIIDGSLAELSRAPSTNELASFYAINPATAAKGVNLLVSKGILEKRRGIGMFVTAGARAALIKEHRATFAESYIAPMLAEARRLELGPAEIHACIDRSLAAPPSLPDSAGLSTGATVRT